jgi:protein-tyrosine phosphatase
MPFDNFRVVEDGVLYRSAAPNYSSAIGDQSQNLTEDDVRFLVDRGISNVISANHIELSVAERGRLEGHNINYLWIQTEDFQSPNADQLTDAARSIQEYSEGGGSLVYCGAGYGRTGTVVAAWEILSGRRPRDEVLNDPESTVETEGQREVLAGLEEGAIEARVALNM